ncbi:molybdate ABC transporter substrate-binding protein [Agromyces atrinae]|uniref:Molybdate ABC transporter substrate-binding protein n=1 Tax=Agromyces atrinae TaxID=592376 RepID=A0A4Q2M813_9MICO|nr:molybdate ABC transporter substrate-binding protein [Agromyces atrinae]NYD66996.1 molybdate transport system substrate-binding protein [Agromyces atrinae]RXZ85270.1 molybdate ABC transporter substrate-binding protein [Agromyces atrinae]RXZ85378.1 molybdate ABC transporter substrate-binding protein [Agromyces atrinae]
MRKSIIAVGAAALLLLTGCQSAEPAATTAPTATADALSGEVIVFAAASLTGSFEELAADFEAEHPGVTVTLNFGGSSALAEQITSGAPADVFAAASPATMQTVVDAGDAAGEPEVFVTNMLEIAVPAGNPGGVEGLTDFTDESRTIALCAPEVPCGAASEKVFAAAGLTPAPDTLEQDVKAALTKVRLGEVDAALVYRTDVLAAGDEVEGIEFAEAEGAINDYPIVRLTESPTPDAADAFIAFVRGERGAEVLGAAGFSAP